MLVRPFSIFMPNSGQVVREGKQRGVRYRLAPISGAASITLPLPVVEATAEAYVPISPEGEGHARGV